MNQQFVVVSCRFHVVVCQIDCHLPELSLDPLTASAQDTLLETSLYPGIFVVDVLDGDGQIDEPWCQFLDHTCVLPHFMCPVLRQDEVERVQRGLCRSDVRR